MSISNGRYHLIIGEKMPMGTIETSLVEEILGQITKNRPISFYKHNTKETNDQKTRNPQNSGTEDLSNLVGSIVSALSVQSAVLLLRG